MTEVVFPCIVEAEHVDARPVPIAGPVLEAMQHDVRAAPAGVKSTESFLGTPAEDWIDAYSEQDEPTLQQ